MWVVCVGFSGCGGDGSGRADVESCACAVLSEARRCMLDGDYAAAEDSIKSMRECFPTAFDARRRGIVLLDSVRMLSARDTLVMLEGLVAREQTVLDSLDGVRRRGHNAEFYAKRTEVFHLKNRRDELDAKVKFYLRKIAVDSEEVVNSSVGGGE